MSQGESTETRNQKPTSRKLRKARDKGQVSQSRELTGALSLTVAVAACALALPWALQAVTGLWNAALRFSVRAALPDALALGHEALLAAAGVSLAVMVPAAVAAMLASRMQTGAVFSVEPLKPQWEHLNPVANGKRILSMRSVMMFALLVAKLLIIGIGVWLVFTHTLGDAVRLVLGGTGAALAVFGKAVLWLTVWGLVGFAAVAALDLAYQRWQFGKDMAMSIGEMRREHKEDEGDPIIKSAQRRAGKEGSVQSQLDLLSMATLLLEDHRGRVIAIYYSPRRHEQALFLMRAADVLGVRVKQIAGESGAPVVLDSELVRALWGRVDTGHPVPPAQAQKVMQLALRFNPKVRA